MKSSGNDGVVIWWVIRGCGRLVRTVVDDDSIDGFGWFWMAENGLGSAEGPQSSYRMDNKTIATICHGKKLVCCKLIDSGPYRAGTKLYSVRLRHAT